MNFTRQNQQDRQISQPLELGWCLKMGESAPHTRYTTRCVLPRTWMFRARHKGDIAGVGAYQPEQWRVVPVHLHGPPGHRLISTPWHKGSACCRRERPITTRSLSRKPGPIDSPGRAICAGLLPFTLPEASSPSSLGYCAYPFFQIPRPPPSPPLQPENGTIMAGIALAHFLAAPLEYRFPLPSGRRFRPRARPGRRRVLQLGMRISLYPNRRARL